MTAARTDQKLHTMGIAITIAVHLLVLGGVYAANKLKIGGGKPPAAEKDLPHIEAGLAIKATTAAGRKTTQTQKQFNTHQKPQDVAVTKKDQPDDKKPKDDEAKDPDDWKKNLHHIPTSDDTPDQPPPEKGDPNGKDSETKQGQATGDPRGTKLNATGNPYEAKLSDRLGSHFEAADFPREEGKLDLDGCFSLNADGTIDLGSLDIHTWVGGGQSTPAFHSAVDRAFRETEKELEDAKTAGQLEAVPADLADGLVKGKKCLHFHN